MECSTEILLYFKQQGKEIKDKIMFYTTFCSEKFLKFLKNIFLLLKFLRIYIFDMVFNQDEQHGHYFFYNKKKEKKVVKKQ